MNRPAFVGGRSADPFRTQPIATVPTTGRRVGTVPLGDVEPHPGQPIMQPHRRAASPRTEGGSVGRLNDDGERMTTNNERAFNEWLRAQLKAKKMSQRQLAQQSGVDHSTISRLIRGDRMPSLGTAAKLARGLRAIHDEADAPAYLGMLTGGNANPTAQVEYALRSDDLLTEAQVRQIMEYYLAVRARRFTRGYAPNPSPDDGSGRSNPGSQHLGGSTGSGGATGGPGGAGGPIAGPRGSAAPRGSASRPIATVTGLPRYVGGPIVRPVGRPPNQNG